MLLVPLMLTHGTHVTWRIFWQIWLSHDILAWQTGAKWWKDFLPAANKCLVQRWMLISQAPYSTLGVHICPYSSFFWQNLLDRAAAYISSNMPDKESLLESPNSRQHKEPKKNVECNQQFFDAPQNHLVKEHCCWFFRLFSRWGREDQARHG